MSTLKLYTVKVSFDFVVAANDVHDAYQVGAAEAAEAFRDLSVRDMDMDVTPGATAYKWDDECIPYGGDGNTRTSEYK